jgi:hypothetical protein
MIQRRGDLQKHDALGQPFLDWNCGFEGGKAVVEGQQEWN